MKNRALSDGYLFDGDATTVFDVYGVGRDWRVEKGCLRVDFGTPAALDVFKVHTQALDRTMQRNLVYGAEFSTDLVDWSQAEEMIQEGSTMNIYPPTGEWRYFRMRMAPERISEIEGWKDGKQLDRTAWRGSNLFAHPDALPAEAAWKTTVNVDEITPTSYLCVAVEGKHGQEGAYAALRMGDRLIGAPSRAVSYLCNPWEYPARRRDTGYTYFFPLDESMVGKELEVVVLGMKGGGKELQPAVWLTAHEFPFKSEIRK